MEQEDDDRLAQRSRHGDPAALAELYRRHAPALLAFLERRLGNRQDAEDVTQETFRRIFAGRGRYDGRGRFRAWLFTIATRLAADRVRAARRHDELLRERRDADATDAPSEPVLAEWTRTCIETVLSDLPEEYAIAFDLRIREGFSYRDMAIICGAPEGTLRSRVHHTLQRIREALASESAAEPRSRRRSAASRTTTKNEGPTGPPNNQGAVP